MIIIKFCRIGAMNKKNGIKLFIGGISPETTAECLRSYFRMFSFVVHSKVEVGKKLKLPKGYGYVTVLDIRSVNRILGQDHYIDGKKVDVEVAKGKSKGGKPAQDLAELIKKEKNPMSTLPTNETAKVERKIMSLQGHMNKYFHQPSRMQSQVEHAKLSKLLMVPSTQVLSKVPTSPRRDPFEAFNTNLQGHHMDLYSMEFQGNQLQDHSDTNKLNATKKLCLGQQGVRPTSRVTEVLRRLNHREVNLRFNPAGSSNQRARDSW